MKTNHSLFSDKYLNSKFQHLELLKIENLSQKLDNIRSWQKSIKNNAIIQSKEESLQGNFLQQFFVEILNYSHQKDTGLWFLETEQKTDDGKKMDGALGFFTIANKTIQADVRVVIELKNAKTDLDKPQTRKNDNRTPVQQAFDYANSLGGTCRWIIVSNFLEIRLYYQTDRTRYQSFDIATLDKEDKLKQFYFLLNKARLINQTGDSITDKLYSERQAEEIEISKKFYSDYKQARLTFFQSLKTYNPAVDELVLLNKTQKLLDRLLFIHFCEDYNILDTYTLRNLIDSAKKDVWNRDNDKIYRRIIALFSAINEGYPELGINKFNGGLFAEDDVFNSLRVDDAILKPVLALIDYDLASDLNVNILGHIFEQSISDIEELKADISGENFDKKQGKRKKDGIYYTPDTITRYIVEEAIGGWLKDRREELKEADLPELTTEDMDSIKTISSGKNKGKFVCNTNIQSHLDFYDAYKEILAHIKVLDPACGSGAFLNQAFDFLYVEGQRVNKELVRLRAGQMSSFDLDKQILENNLFGVDLNQESVEITKLSLWLKTANRYNPLTSLDNNIKCGNSLIDDVSVAGDKAFVWELEFKAVMDKGGFDVVIGNPPYLRLQGLKDAHYQQSLFYENNYQAATGNYDIYVLFLEKAYKLLANNGISSFILPHKWLISEFGIGIRKLFSTNKAVEKIDHFESYFVFDEVTTYTCITTLSKKAKDAFQFRRVNPKELSEKVSNYTAISYELLSSENWNLGEQAVANLLQKINKQALKVSDVFEKVFAGIQTSADSIYLIKGEKEGNFIKGYSEQLKKTVILESDFMKPLVKGDDVSRYKSLNNRYYVIFPYLLNNGKVKPMIENDIKVNFPKSYQYLKENEIFLRNREKGKFDNDNWFLFGRQQGLVEVNKTKFVSPDITLGMNLSCADETVCIKNGAYGIIISDDFKDCEKHFLAITNSSLMWFFLKKTGAILRGGYFRFNTNYIYNFRFPEKSSVLQSDLSTKANTMLEQNKTLQQLQTAFLSFVQADLKPQKLSTKLQRYYDLSWDEFKTELKKSKVDLNKTHSLNKVREWQELFEKEKQQALAIKTLIEQTDKEIDHLVYALYGLTADDIAIIENS